MRYTMGKGGVGLEREAYYAGWVVIGELLHDGWTFPKFARVKNPEMVTLVGTAIDRLISSYAHS